MGVALAEIPARAVAVPEKLSVGFGIRVIPLGSLESGWVDGRVWSREMCEMRSSAVERCGAEGSGQSLLHLHLLE